MENVLEGRGPRDPEYRSAAIEGGADVGRPGENSTINENSGAGGGEGGGSAAEVRALFVADDETQKGGGKKGYDKDE